MQTAALSRADAAPSPSLADAVRAEQVALLYGDGGATYFSTLASCFTLSGILVWQGTLAPAPAALWLGWMLVQTLARVGLRVAYVRARPPVADARKWGARFVMGCVVSGVSWGVGMPLLLAEGRLDLQALVIGALVIGTYGVIGSAGMYRPAFYMFFLPFPSAILWMVAQGDILHFASAALLMLWLPSVAVMGQRYGATLEEALRLRFENAVMAEDLRAAGEAKSRFLAAASHDLRQPVHALGMFIGALRNQPLPERAQALVAQMDTSIGALDGLFGALLDMSTLDAGVVEARPAAVALQPLLARICAELEPEASAKRVELVLAPARDVVRSDPVLLERILRNLIGNAVRYTDRGWVLVGCRRRREGICLEVRDTGPGIPLRLQEAVFEEFFQVGNPDRDRTRGLGLGLPIVRRLAAILDHRLELESRPGRGTIFRLHVPRAEGVCEAAPDPEPAAEGLTRRTALRGPAVVR